MIRIIIVVFCVFLNGCTLGNFNSIYRKPTLEYGRSHIVDAKQRFVLTYPGLVKMNSQGEIIPTATITCAEPSPDVFSVYAASGEAMFSRGDVGASGSFSSAETGASLVERTTALQALRDSYFRLCEGFGNGMIDEIDFMIGQRHNQTALMGLLAIEEMKAASRAAPVVIGGRATANSASGILSLTKMVEQISVDIEELKEEQQKKEDEKEGVKEDKQAAQKKADIDPGTPPDPAKQAEKEKGQKDVEALGKKEESLEQEIKKIKARIEAKKENRTKLLEAIGKGGATGTLAESIIQNTQPQQQVCNEKCVNYREAIAKQMVEVVRLVDDNDFGPTICLSYLRKTSPPDIPTRTSRRSYGATQSIMSETCREVMREYVAGLREKRLIQRDLTQAVINGKIKVEDLQRALQLAGVGDGSGMQVLQQGQTNIRFDGSSDAEGEEGVAVGVRFDGLLGITPPAPVEEEEAENDD